jgi:hypothetical protein
VRRHPVDAEQAANAHIKAEFFAEFAAYGIGGRFVGFGHAAGQVPVRSFHPEVAGQGLV